MCVCVCVCVRACVRVCSYTGDSTVSSQSTVTKPLTDIRKKGVELIGRIRESVSRPRDRFFVVSRARLSRGGRERRLFLWESTSTGELWILCVCVCVRACVRVCTTLPISVCDF